MSLLPYILDDIYPSHYYPDTWVSPIERSFLRPFLNSGNDLRSQLSRMDEIEKMSHIGKDGFQVCLDVEHFQPNEISVKTENNSIVINAKHEEKKDNHGYISREFTRRYELPKDFKIEDVTSSLSSDGVLSIKCPKPPAIEGANQREIEIQQTGPAKMSIKSNEKKGKNIQNGS